MSLLQRVELYLRRHRISATRFGQDSMQDPNLVFELRNGRQLRRKTAARLRAWLEGEEPGQ
jgi:hypothetical protein